EAERAVVPLHALEGAVLARRRVRHQGNIAGTQSVEHRQDVRRLAPERRKHIGHRVPQVECDVGLRLHRPFVSAATRTARTSLSYTWIVTSYVPRCLCTVPRNPRLNRYRLHMPPV